MSDDIDIFVSNGTCYSSAHLKADSAMIPCGNDANDHVACCQAADNCLESSVCYSPEYGVTYISGCSDPSYEHPSCPNKFNDRATPWLGLSYCNGTSNEWVICDQKKKSPVLTKPDTCFCPTDEDDRTMTLSQSSIIKGTASLPTTLGESIQFSRGYYPTVNSNVATATASTADTSITSSSLSSFSPAFTEATSNDNSTIDSPDYPPQQSGLSPGAKIGTIAGAVIGTLLLALMATGWMCLRRRRQKQQLQREEEERAVDNFMHGESKGGAASEPDPLNLGLAMGPASDAASSNLNTPAPSELDTKAARPWSMRSELEPETTTRPFHAMTTGGQEARRAPSELAAHPIAELPG